MKTSEFDELIKDKDNIIFDFGGIFVDIDYSVTVNNLSVLSGKDASMLYSKQKQSSIFNDYEIGRISSAEFIFELKKSLKIEADDSYVIEAWNSMLTDIHIERYEYLKKLKETKNIFMLSNINQIHEEFIGNYINCHETINDFYELFHGIYFSHKIGYRKPTPEAFEFVIEKNNLDVNRTFFIDDSPQHVEGAIKIGLDAIHLDPPNSFVFSKS